MALTKITNIAQNATLKSNMDFPTLYKKTSTGAIAKWLIRVDDDTASSIITTIHGQVDGKLQETKDRISEGKNIGKKNATTHFEQACKEAQAKWEKQLKKGYVQTLESANADETDDLIEGGVLPMLAHKFAEQGHKIKYPAYVQPKLDGIRCIAIVDKGACTLWSRTRKQITSCPHIVQELEAYFDGDSIILDGELYNHAFKANFEHIVHLVRQETPDEKHADVQYHIYDIISDEPQNKRVNNLTDLETSMFQDENDLSYSSLRFVKTTSVAHENEVMDFFNAFLQQGYEGVMLRNKESKYVNKRSYDLLKVKEFSDDEFSVVGIEEGRGKLQGHVGAFICKNSKGQEFSVKMSGDTRKLREYFLDSALWQGKLLTVQYQGLTSYGIPRFPVGLRFRDEP